MARNHTVSSMRSGDGFHQENGIVGNCLAVGFLVSTSLIDAGSIGRWPLGIVGRAKTTDEYDLAFNVWSQNYGCAACDLVPARGTNRHAWGVLYEIPADLIRGQRQDKRRTLAEIWA